jgi:hypothetical protein
MPTASMKAKADLHLFPDSFLTEALISRIFSSDSFTDTMFREECSSRVRNSKSLKLYTLAERKRIVRFLEKPESISKEYLTQLVITKIWP